MKTKLMMTAVILSICLIAGSVESASAVKQVLKKDTKIEQFCAKKVENMSPRKAKVEYQNCLIYGMPVKADNSNCKGSTNRIVKLLCKL